MYNAVADRALHGSIPDPGGRWETTAAAYILYPLVQSTITTIHLLFPLCLHAAFYAARGRERLKISMSLSLSRVQPTEFVISSDGDEWIEITRC